MKALEKAAKDRDEARAEPVATAPGGPPSEPETLPGHLAAPEPAPAAAPGPRSELTLEPIAAADRARGVAAARPAGTAVAPAAAARAGRGAAGSTRAAGAGRDGRAGRRRRGAAAARSPGCIARPVLIVRHHRGTVRDRLRDLRLPATLPSGALPAASRRSRRRARHRSSPIGQAPAPGTGTVPALGPTGAAGPDTRRRAQRLAPRRQDPLRRRHRRRARRRHAVPAARCRRTAAPDFTPLRRACTAARSGESAAAEAPPALPPPPPAPRDTIVVSRGSAAPPTVSPLLNDAYTALQADRRDDAQRAYEQLLRTEPRNIDALLGLAAIATTEGRSDEATRRYLQILELDPRNTLAQSGADRAARPRRSAGGRVAAEAADRARALGLPAFHARQPLRRPVPVGAGAAGVLPGPSPRAEQPRLRLQPRRRPGAREPAEARPRLLPPRGPARRRHRARPLQPRAGPGTHQQARLAGRIAGRVPPDRSSVHGSMGPSGSIHGRNAEETPARRAAGSAGADHHRSALASRSPSSATTTSRIGRLLVRLGFVTESAIRDIMARTIGQESIDLAAGGRRSGGAEARAAGIRAPQPRAADRVRPARARADDRHHARSSTSSRWTSCARCSARRSRSRRSSRARRSSRTTSTSSTATSCRSTAS